MIARAPYIKRIAAATAVTLAAFAMVVADAAPAGAVEAYETPVTYSQTLANNFTMSVLPIEEMELVSVEELEVEEGASETTPESSSTKIPGNKQEASDNNQLGSGAQEDGTGTEAGDEVDNAAGEDAADEEIKETEDELDKIGGGQQGGLQEGSGTGEAPAAGSEDGIWQQPSQGTEQAEESDENTQQDPAENDDDRRGASDERQACGGGGTEGANRATSPSGSDSARDACPGCAEQASPTQAEGSKHLENLERLRYLLSLDSI